MKHMKKIIGSVALVTALGLGAFAISSVLPAGAQSSPDPSSSSSAPATTGKHPRAARARVLLGKAIDVSAGAIGITPADLKTELKAGKSIADVASDHRVSLDTVTTALTDAANTAIDKAVTDGKITQDRADKIKGRLPQRIERFENGHKGDLRKALRDRAASTSS